MHASNTPCSSFVVLGIQLGIVLILILNHCLYLLSKGAAGSDDGNYFEVDEKGQIKLRPGKKKIDLSKLTDDDLRKLGIDPSLSKQEIARLLKVSLLTFQVPR